jgi:hypothetical protein
MGHALFPNGQLFVSKRGTRYLVLLSLISLINNIWGQRDYGVPNFRCVVEHFTCGIGN